VLADEAKETVLASHVVWFLEEDSHVVIALLKTLRAELTALKGWFFALALGLAHCNGLQRML
jgi:hypothetical protein